jgi:uncharacterized protein
MKYLLVALVLVVAVWVLLARARRVKSKPPQSGAGPSERTSQTSDSESSVAMVACCHCGVHLPQSDAVFDLEGQVFCSPEHQRAGPRKR